MVLVSHAVIDPRTMVVESLHAFIADCTVLRSRSGDCFAFHADFTRFELLEKLEEALFWRFEISWIRNQQSEYRSDRENSEEKADKRVDLGKLGHCREYENEI